MNLMHLDVPKAEILSNYSTIVMNQYKPLTLLNMALTSGDTNLPSLGISKMEA